MVLYPDPTTFAILPWEGKENTSCRLICDVYTTDDKQFEGDPRYVLECALNKMRDNGMIYMCASEIEFFLVRLNVGTKSCGSW
jgi:glutamine synthetase